MAEEAKDVAVDVNPERMNGEEVAPASYSHVLTKSIMAHGDEVTELKWREPTAGDIERAGNPILIEFREDESYPRMRFDEKKMNSMISLLCAIPPSSVRMITAGDWQTIAFKLSRFFMPKGV